MIAFLEGQGHAALYAYKTIAFIRKNILPV